MGKPHAIGRISAWARDFAIMGAAVGALAPLAVILNPEFAAVGGAIGMITGAAFGVTAGAAVEQFRNRIPLSVMVASASVLGALWGATVGLSAGAAVCIAGMGMGPEALFMGFICGGCSGMVYVGGLFLPYMIASSQNRTAPVVFLGVLAAPLAGWAGLAALLASTFGLWLFALPPLLWAAIAVDRSVERARLVADSPKALTG